MRPQVFTILCFKKFIDYIDNYPLEKLERELVIEAGRNTGTLSL